MSMSPWLDVIVTALVGLNHLCKQRGSKRLLISVVTNHICNRHVLVRNVSNIRLRPISKLMYFIGNVSKADSYGNEKLK